MNLKRVKRAIISVSDKSNLKIILPILKKFKINLKISSMYWNIFGYGITNVIT